MSGWTTLKHLNRSARHMALASLPAELPPDEVKRRLFKRLYGTPAPLSARPRGFPRVPAGSARTAGFAFSSGVAKVGR